MHRFFSILAVVLLLLVTLVIPVSPAAAAAPQGDCEWRWTSLDGSAQSARYLYPLTRQQCLNGPLVTSAGGELGSCSWRWAPYDHGSPASRQMVLTRMQCIGF